MSEAANYYALVEMDRAYAEKIGKRLTTENVIDSLIVADKINVD